tara:strand:- start:1951 stop:3963 length:2013 start_codon:yes stop_codon:yes gene_type:complete
MGFYHIADEPAIELNPTHADFYQEKVCTYSVFELLTQDLGTYDIILQNSPNGDIECFGKNSWYEYQPEKLIENGWEKYEKDYIKIWLFTNINVDLLIQSIFWLIIISFIPKTKDKKFNNIFLFSFLNTCLFYLHLIGEEGYYKSLTREYDIQLISREFNGDLYFENYFLYIYLLTIFLISYIFIHFAESRFNNLLNYLPFIFLLYGTFTSLNLNFYLILFSMLGVYSIYEKHINLKITIIYFGFSIFWLFNLNKKDLNFDVDKLRGFINSSQSLTSLIFWVLIYYLIINGVIFLIKESKEYFDSIIFRRNLLISSSLITLLGLLAATSKLSNYISFYFLGLNKYGMRSLDSVEGNTWRGLAPSAEGMGEFFAFVILFFVIYSYEKKLNFNFFELVLLLFPIIGLARSNNFAAISSSVVIILIYFLNKKIKSKKFITLLFVSIITLSVLIYTQFFREFSYNYLSSNILFEGIQASEINYEMNTNEYGEDQASLANYQYVLEIPEEQANLSSSLRFLVENYTYGYNIKYLPSINSLVNVGSYFINRSEKWGVFFAKYNPNLSEFLFGYGPQQITDYYFEHPTKYNYGLFLPHSTFLSYLLFFGMLGSIIILYLMFKFLYSQGNLLTLFFIAYFILNFIKSDSLLYLPNLLFIVFIIHFPFSNKNKKDKNNIE